MESDKKDKKDGPRKRRTTNKRVKKLNNELKELMANAERVGVVLKKDPPKKKEKKESQNEETPTRNGGL
jgi:fatty acid-binding protein DegV